MSPFIGVRINDDTDIPSSDAMARIVSCNAYPKPPTMPIMFVSVSYCFMQRLKKSLKFPSTSSFMYGWP